MSILGFSSYHAGAARNGYDCTGAETAATGTYANFTGCGGTGGCHSTSATSTISVAIELDSAGVPTTHYKGGMTYTIKITGTSTGGSFAGYGFQLAALKGIASAATNADAGTWATTGLPTSTRITAPGTYTQLTIAEQSTGIALGGTTFSKSFTWTAPSTGTGAISFWGVTNFVNLNGSQDAGDKWNTTNVTINEWIPGVSVKNVADNISINVFPNPVVNTMNIQLSNMQPGTYNLTAFDLTGRTVSNENFAVSGSEYAASINTNNWQAGIYQVVLSNNNIRKTFTVVKK